MTFWDFVNEHLFICTIYAILMLFMTFTFLTNVLQTIIYIKAMKKAKDMNEYIKAGLLKVEDLNGEGKEETKRPSS